jgi:hypothetical protein
MELELRFELSKVQPIAGALYMMINSLPNIATVELCGVPYVLFPKVARYFDERTKAVFGGPDKEKKIFTLDDYDNLEVVKVDNPEETKLFIFELPGGGEIYKIVVVIKDSYHWGASCSVFDVRWLKEDRYKFVVERLPFNMENADEEERHNFAWNSVHVVRRSSAIATFLYTFINFDFEGENPQLRLCKEDSRDYASSVKEQIKSLGSNFDEAVRSVEILSYFI